MKTVVFAYHTIGCIGIKALLRHGFDISAVFTHTDHPGENIWFDSVAELAAKHQIPVFAPEDCNHPLWERKIRELQPDIIFSFYYRQLLKKAILDIPPAGGLNLHGSLLPKYRGRSPVNWVLVKGEKQTGVTLHYMTPKPDDGDIVAQTTVAISDNDTARTLFDSMAHATEGLLDDVLPRIKSGTAPRNPQQHEIATYFGGRGPSDGEIDWSAPAQEIRNLVRAVTKPYPGAFSQIGERKCFFWEVTVSDHDGPQEKAGTVLSTQPFIISSGQGAIQVLFGQLENDVYCSGEQLASELNLVTGMLFGTHPVSSMKQRKKTVMIMGVNGFIGNALTERLLQKGNMTVYGMDINANHIKRFLGSKDFEFKESDISIHREWIEYHIKKCDVVIPLVAIATPIEYIRNPLHVFELDFEENLRIFSICLLNSREYFLTK